MMTEAISRCNCVRLSVVVGFGVSNHFDVNSGVPAIKFAFSRLITKFPFLSRFAWGMLPLLHSIACVDPVKQLIVRHFRQSATTKHLLSFRERFRHC